jgi:meiotic recombination protein SPO11
MNQHSTDEQMPVYGLVDWDPDGIGILSIYKHGSASTQQHDNPRMPGIRWLGLTSEDVSRNGEQQSQQQLLMMSQRDRRKARKMLEWKRFGEHSEEDYWRKELQLMLILGYKAEIQLLDQLAVGVHGWIVERLLYAETR